MDVAMVAVCMTATAAAAVYVVVLARRAVREAVRLAGEAGYARGFREGREYEAELSERLCGVGDAYQVSREGLDFDPDVESPGAPEHLR